MDTDETSETPSQAPHETFTGAPADRTLTGKDRLFSRPDRSTTVTLALDPNDADRLADARSTARRLEAAAERAESKAQLAPNDQGRADTAEHAREAADEAAAKLEALEASLVTFTVHLRAIGPRRVEELLLSNRPTEKQRKNAKALANGDPKAQPDFNEDTFPPALLAEAITRIEFSDGDTIDALSVAEVTELWAGRWTQGDRAMLLQAAMQVNQAPSAVGDLGKG
jgi:hypothetical protein